MLPDGPSDGDCQMNGLVANAYRRLEDAKPLVRPTYNQLEVVLLPPYGDPEVHLPSEVWTYFVTGLFVNMLVDFIQTDSQGQ